MATAMSFKRGGEETSERRKLKIALIAERLTDCADEHYVTGPMAHGKFWEDAARRAYEEKTGNIVALCGFARHDTIDNFGASPDGLLGADGCLEIKCPTVDTFTRWILEKDMPPDYKPQMLAQMAVTKRKWCDFVAFFPTDADVAAVEDEFERLRFGKITMPPSHRIKVWRYIPDPAEIEAVESAAVKFLDEVETMWDFVLTQGEI